MVTGNGNSPKTTLPLLCRTCDRQAALERLQETLLGVVSHEIRTPLALLFQALEILEDERFGDLTEAHLDALMALRRQAQSLGRLFEGLTRVAAFLSKQGTVRPVWARLEPVLVQVLPLAQFKARSREIGFETDIPTDLPPLRLDVKEMAEALDQLLDNAIKFNRPGGRVKFSVAAHPESVLLTVTDTGQGINSETLERMWQVFEQDVDPLRRAQAGLGLGLVLAREIVEAHRGTITVETEVGQGSTFTVTLPRQTSIRLSDTSALKPSFLGRWRHNVRSS
jgi:signal transduction histidine kinase